MHLIWNKNCMKTFPYLSEMRHFFVYDLVRQQQWNRWEYLTHSHPYQNNSRKKLFSAVEWKYSILGAWLQMVIRAVNRNLPICQSGHVSACPQLMWSGHLLSQLNCKQQGNFWFLKKKIVFSLFTNIAATNTEEPRDTASVTSLRQIQEDIGWETEE